MSLYLPTRAKEWTQCDENVAIGAHWKQSGGLPARQDSEKLAFWRRLTQTIRMYHDTTYSQMQTRPPGGEAVHFHRTELLPIMSLYGRMVAAGEWRDYGMAGLKDVAIFSIFRRTAEHPIYRIEKRPKLTAKQGMYSVIGMDGRILKRGSDLKAVLRVLERKLIRMVD